MGDTTTLDCMAFGSTWRSVLATMGGRLSSSWLAIKTTKSEKEWEYPGPTERADQPKL